MPNLPFGSPNHRHSALAPATSRRSSPSTRRTFFKTIGAASLLGGCAGIQRTVGDLYADARDFIWGGPEDERHPLMVARQDQVDTLIREAQDDYLREVAKRWGTDAKIPTRKLWVHYDPLMVTRAVMDFEGGELRAETLIETDGDRWQALRRLEQTVTGTRAASAADLKALDGTRARAESAAQKQGLALPGADQTFATVPLFEEVLPPEPEGRLEEQPVVGDDGMVRTKLGLVVPFIDGHYGRLAMNFAEPIMRDARRHEVEPSLLLAIMQAESAFNPRATSHIPAYGLMQIVPTSAGLDAYDFVHGMMRLLGPEYLYDPDNNIELGSAYLWILDGRYLRAIENSESRLYCVIAAYNTGAGNVARTFSGTTSVRQAAPVINALTPGEVFARLEQDLPYDETRAYLVKVNGARETYGSWDDALRADHA